ncbi:MAG: T9SS type A sorting domain-containing protein [Bacteroidota bacterium]
MLTQTFSQKGLGKLCPDFSKIAFIFFVLFAGFASQEVKGQVIVVIEDVNLFESHASNLKVCEEDRSEGTLKIKLNNQIEVYPNPFNSKLTIGLTEDDGLSYLSLTDENGIAVWEQNVYSIPSNFMIASLEPGTYYLTLSLSGGSYTETVVYEN